MRTPICLFAAGLQSQIVEKNAIERQKDLRQSLEIVSLMEAENKT